MRYTTYLAALLTALVLTACGGGGGSPGANPSAPIGGATPLPVPAAITILAAANTLPSASSAQVALTVLVTDASNNAIPNQSVTFSATSGNLIGALPIPQTGANGALSTVLLSAGSDSSNRNITVTAVAGGARATIAIPVVGTSVSITGLGSVLAGAATSFTVRAQDSAARAIPNAVLRITSSLNNSVSQANLTTDASGVATFIYTANNAGNDTLRVDGLGASAQTAVSVSAEDFRFTSPASGTSIAVGTTQTVSIRFVTGGVPAAGRTVTFSTTRGSVTPSTLFTDSNGVASTVLTGQTSGPANVLAQVSTAQATLPVQFVAILPATVVLQANPSSVLPNTGGGTTNQITLQATVRDAAGNPVPGRIVNFTAISDASNGTISPGSGTSDANGNVSVQFTPGALSTANNGVVINASVQNTLVTGQTMLTVSGQALFISIGLGNVISNFDPTTYERQFTVFVTDANGAPASNRVISLSSVPTVYRKGSLVFSMADSVWGFALTPPTSCVNEDANRNGSLDTGEDFNSNGRLTPGLPTVVTPGSITTDTNGVATFRLRYGENFVPWITTLITARAVVGGTESVTSLSFALDGVASDFSSATNPPAGVNSPFGLSTDCAIAN